jgi:hypothetical protein
VVVGTANFSMNTTVYATSIIMKIIKEHGRNVKNVAIFWEKSSSNWNQKIRLILLSTNDHSEEINQDQSGLKMGLNLGQKNWFKKSGFGHLTLIPPKRLPQ